ncbi:MAG: YHS domain-containing (seleno)protein [Myxococcota bacterium]
MQTQKHTNRPESGIGLEGYSPVSYHTQGQVRRGDPAIFAQFGGATYHFYDEAEREAFLAEPLRYLPEYGGFCAFAMGAEGGRAPADPRTFKIVGGRLFLFYNEGGTNTLEQWNEQGDEAGQIARADDHWSAQVAADWLDAEVQARPLTVLVFFRGDWCPWCQGYLKDLGGEFVQRVRARGGELFAVTAQSPEGARAAARDWALPFGVVSDPSLTLARRFDVAITPREQTPLAADATAYPHGMSQPAVIAIDRDGKTLYRWAIDPAEANLGGASDRPVPADVWAQIEAALEGRDAPTEWQTTDLGYMQQHHPRLHSGIKAWLEANA